MTPGRPHREFRHKENITFNDNDTVSFLEARSFQFQPDKSQGSESDYIVMPNILALVRLSLPLRPRPAPAPGSSLPAPGVGTSPGMVGHVPAALALFFPRRGHLSWVTSLDSSVHSRRGGASGTPEWPPMPGRNTTVLMHGLGCQGHPSFSECLRLAGLVAKGPWAESTARTRKGRSLGDRSEVSGIFFPWSHTGCV